MPTPNDYSNFQFNNPGAGTEQKNETPTYPNIYDRNQMTGTEEIDRQEVTSRPSDPLELHALAEQSADRFRELQSYLNSSMDTIGSRFPGAGDNLAIPSTCEALKK